MFLNINGKFFQDVTFHGRFGHIQKGHGDSVYVVGGHRLGYPVNGLWGGLITGWDATNKTHTRSDYFLITF